MNLHERGPPVNWAVHGGISKRKATRRRHVVGRRRLADVLVRVGELWVAERRIECGSAQSMCVKVYTRCVQLGFSSRLVFAFHQLLIFVAQGV